ncbi:MAG: M3 family oligoendopeptidase, partial [Saprospiraceae bacterium]
MTFNDFQYNRPKMETYAKEFNALIDRFESASDLENQIKAMGAIDEMRAEFDTMYNLCSIRHTVNTKDKFYEEENNYFDMNSPKYQELVTRYYKALLAAGNRVELEAKSGNLLFVMADLSTKTFEPTILEDLQEENRLKSEYTKVKAKAEIEYEGEKYNLSTISELHESKDRATRKGSYDARWEFFANQAETVEKIYHDLVAVRTRIAKKLGYGNFVELGYARMLRSDYDAKMAANYRKQILEHVVPVATKLRDRQRKRLGLEELLYHDEGFKFKSGNPTPKGEAQWIVDHAKTMYKELSAETHEFFSFMNDKGLMDLVAKDGKATGGYCTFLKK